HYVLAYGPATIDHMQHWLGGGLGVGGKRLLSWIARLGDRLAAIDVDGEQAYIPSERLAELAAVSTSTAVRLLPRFDQWVLGPGTADHHVVPPARRSLLSRGAAIVIVGGAVSGTWSLRNDQVAIGWFTEAGSPPRQAL